MGVPIYPLYIPRHHISRDQNMRAKSLHISTAVSQLKVSKTKRLIYTIIFFKVKIDATYSKKLLKVQEIHEL